MNPRREAQIAADVGGTGKTLRIVNGCTKCQRAKGANPRYFHEAPTNLIVMSSLFQLAVDHALIGNQAFTMVREISQLRHQIAGPVTEDPPDLSFHHGPESVAPALAAQPAAEQLDLTTKHAHRGYPLTDQVPSNGKTGLQGLAVE